MDLLTTATSADERERGAQIAVLPVGSFEQHGDHLPLTTDTIVACTIARAVADHYGLFLLPPITISCSHLNSGFPGTVSIRASTLYAVVADIAESLKASGIASMLLIGGHGGNHALSSAAQELNAGAFSVALYPGPAHWQFARVEAGLATDQHEDLHAGELETSVLMHATRSLVRDSYEIADHDARNRPLLLLLGMKGYTETGVIGRPSLAEAAKGKALIESLTAQAELPISALRP